MSWLQKTPVLLRGAGVGEVSCLTSAGAPPLTVPHVGLSFHPEEQVLELSVVLMGLLFSFACLCLNEIYLSSVCLSSFIIFLLSLSPAFYLTGFLCV